jgi:hypothetical protein
MTAVRAMLSALRALVSTLLSKGVISPGWYSILTGLAMLYVAYLLGPAVDTDPAAVFVGLTLGVVGVWSIERGIRSEVQRHRAD